MNDSVYTLEKQPYGMEINRVLSVSYLMGLLPVRDHQGNLCVVVMPDRAKREEEFLSSALYMADRGPLQVGEQGELQGASLAYTPVEFTSALLREFTSRTAYPVYAAVPVDSFRVEGSAREVGAACV